MSKAYDPRDPVAASKPQGFVGWLKGRMSRRESWASVGCLLAVGLIVAYFPGGPKLEVVLGVVPMFLQIRRVQDVGRRGWWAVAATFAPAVLISPRSLIGLLATSLISFALEFMLLVVVGVAPGNASDNRFGTPPPFTAKRVFTGR
jgi:uncharacterized membrane protein YhaH (DUF805 family)